MTSASLKLELDWRSTEAPMTAGWSRLLPVSTANGFASAAFTLSVAGLRSRDWSPFAAAVDTGHLRPMLTIGRANRSPRFGSNLTPRTGSHCGAAGHSNAERRERQEASSRRSQPTDSRARASHPRRRPQNHQQLPARNMRQLATAAAPVLCKHLSNSKADLSAAAPEEPCKRAL